MSSDLDVFKTAAELSGQGKAFVIVTVVRTDGRTPRDAGAKMIWLPGGEIIGTVGGGRFEQLVSEAAAKRFSDRSCGLEKYTLGADADQCCGGNMEVFFEYQGAHQRVVLFGAGHVAQAVAKALEPARMEVVVVDDRGEWNTAERFAHCRRVFDFQEGVKISLEQPEATLACVMTYSHDVDEDVLRGLLAKPPAFVGLIGSKSKWACFVSRLAGAGVEEGAIERVQCPVGLGDMGKEPELVAVSIAGQILLEAANLAKL